jgi:hypothetical protein
MGSRILIHNLGYPRMGALRQLKKSLEAYWRGTATAMVGALLPAASPLSEGTASIRLRSCCQSDFT